MINTHVKEAEIKIVTEDGKITHFKLKDAYNYSCSIDYHYSEPHYLGLSDRTFNRYSLNLSISHIKKLERIDET